MNCNRHWSLETCLCALRAVNSIRDSSVHGLRRSKLALVTREAVCRQEKMSALWNTKHHIMPDATSRGRSNATIYTDRQQKLLDHSPVT